MRILIAEDEAVSRTLLKTALKKWGYEVVVTRNGEEAWQVFQEEDPPQMAIIDCVMPEMDGIELCTKVRASPDLYFTYIIMATSMDSQDNINEAYKAGIDHYLNKPVNPDELLERIRVGERIIRANESKHQDSADKAQPSESIESITKILIAEDDGVSRSILEDSLREWGYEVEVTSNGEEAWLAFQEEDPPQMAILDWMMPKMSGIDLCSRLRKDPKFLNTYIIMLSGRDDEKHVQMGYKAGADTYLTKPVKRNLLKDRVEFGERIVKSWKDVSQKRDERES